MKDYTSCYKLLLAIMFNLCCPPIQAADSVSTAQVRYLSQISKAMANNEPLDAWQMSQKLLNNSTQPAIIYSYACNALMLLPLKVQLQQDMTAKECWQQGYEANPGDQTIALSLVNVLLADGQPELSLDILTSRTIDWPSLQTEASLQHQYMLAYTYYLLKQYRQVITVAKVSLTTITPAPIETATRNQINPSLRPLLLEAYLSLSDWAEANSEVKAWLRDAPTDLQAWQYARRLAWQREDLNASAVINEVLLQLQPSGSLLIEQLALYANIGAANLAADCLNQSMTPKEQLWCLHQGKLAGLESHTLEKAKAWRSNLEHLDDYWLLTGELMRLSGNNKDARAAWEHVGQSSLASDFDGQYLTFARKTRDQKQALATMLIGQSLWNEQLFSEAEVYFRKLKRLPGYKTFAASYLEMLDLLQPKS